MLRTAAIFKNKMVLQRNSEVSVFGSTDCDLVEVIWNGVKSKADIDGGNWLAKIVTGDIAEGMSLTILGKKSNGEKEEIVIDDILLGDVWLAGGQSNMELELRNSFDGENVARKADFDYIRFYNVPKHPSVDAELFEFENNTCWNDVKGEACRYMSAVAFYFAKRIYEETKVPVGIIDCYWGGTSATCWVEQEALKDVPEVSEYLEEWNYICNSKTEEEDDNELAEYNDKVNKWIETEAEVKAKDPNAGVREVCAIAGDYPWPPPRGAKSPFRPFGLHKSMVSRIAPYTIKGIIYYQAEEDCERAAYYSKLNSAVIRQWRKDFGGKKPEDIPFYITQLPMFISDGAEDDKSWCILREQQEKCAKDNDNTCIAVICDCGEYDNIHPIDKKTPGNRLAQQALINTYNMATGAANLSIKNGTFGDRAVLTFDNTYGELCYKESNGVMLTANEELKVLKEGIVEEGVLWGFEISNDGINYYSPKIMYSDERLTFVGENGKIITDVRYGWFNYGVANVYSKKGNPLMPFWLKKD